MQSFLARERAPECIHPAIGGYYALAHDIMGLVLLPLLEIELSAPTLLWRMHCSPTGFIAH